MALIQLHEVLHMDLRTQDLHGARHISVIPQYSPLDIVHNDLSHQHETPRETLRRGAITKVLQTYRTIDRPQNIGIRDLTQPLRHTTLPHEILV